ncbi:MAG: hypothetical protein IJ489_09470 [Clostridia bacterium]|nr:hypothetical protein [Clostridia bacterium]
MYTQQPKQPKLTFTDKRDAKLHNKAQAKSDMIEAKYKDYVNAQMEDMNTMLVELRVKAKDLMEQIANLSPDDPDMIVLTAELTATEQILEDTQYIRDGFLLAIRIALVRLNYSLKYCLTFRWYDAILSLNTKHLDKILGRRNADYAAVLSDILNISDAIATRIDKIGVSNESFQMFRNNINKTTNDVLSKQTEESRRKYEEVMERVNKERKENKAAEERRQSINNHV